MAYQLLFSVKSLKSLQSIAAQDAATIVEALEELSKNTDEKSNVKRLVKHLRATFRLRVGDYRVLFDKEDKLRVIDVIDIGHRKNIY